MVLVLLGNILSHKRVGGKPPLLLRLKDHPRSSKTTSRTIKHRKMQKSETTNTTKTTQNTLYVAVFFFAEIGGIWEEFGRLAGRFLKDFKLKWKEHNSRS